MEQLYFGQTQKGEEAHIYRFQNSHGVVMQVTDLGATLQTLLVPDSAGQLYDVVLGYDSVPGYEQGNGNLGATVGRNANRIGKARFVLQGKTYSLAQNDGQNNLHSGLDYYFLRIWKVKECTDQSITFSLHSPDGDQGYPGALDMEVTYTLTEDNEVKISYFGVPDQDTVINMTNHSYFNLNGHASGDILQHTLWVDADSFTRADEESIPTGEIVPVEGTPMDFREKKTIGKEIDVDYEALIFGKGYDHNWCLNNKGKLQKVAEVSGDITGITMEVITDLPGVQIYTGNFLEAEQGKEGAVYRKRQGVCFETQYYPDAINHPNFPSPVCKATETYQTTTVYRFV